MCFRSCVPLRTVSDVLIMCSAHKTYKWMRYEMINEAIKSSCIRELYFQTVWKWLFYTEGNDTVNSLVLCCCLGCSKMFLLSHSRCNVVICVPDHLWIWLEWSDHNASLRHNGPPSQLYTPGTNTEAAGLLDWQQSLTAQGHLLRVQQQQLATLNAKLTQVTNTL